jgi:hypothetical protein
MVIIGVREGYRQDGTVAMRMGCAEVPGAVENVWNAWILAGIGGVVAWIMWKTLFHVERFLGCQTSFRSAS